MDWLIRLIADGLVFIILMAAAATYLVEVRRNIYQQYARSFMAGLTALTVAKLMSLFYETAERPFVTLGVAPKAAFLDNPGFPSDHALFVMTLTLIVCFATGRKKVAIILLVLSLLVGLGRVVALVHTPQDVIGGYAAAVIGVGLWYFGRRRKALA